MELILQNQSSLIEFFILLLLCSCLSFSIKISYKKFTNNTFAQFELSRSFVLITISTFFVILLVKNSISLSLGLVGALSIVRFRTPIKDPLELAMIFACIAIGIACAVNFKLMVIIFTLFVHFVIISSYVIKNKEFVDKNPGSLIYLIFNNKNNYIMELESDNKIETEIILNILKTNDIKYKILSQSIGKNNILILQLSVNNDFQSLKITELIKNTDKSLMILLRENV